MDADPGAPAVPAAGAPAARGPWVTVVVPLYNKADYVGACVASVLAQTDPGFELVVVDDGSTDASVERVRAAAGDDARVRVLRRANGGVSAARNAGIEAARTDWVALLDADDLWRPGFLRAVRAAIDAHPDAAMVATGYAALASADAAGPVDAPAEAPRAPAAGAPRRADLMRLWAERGGCPTHASAVALRRDAVRRVGGFPVGMSLGEDLLTWIRVAGAGPFVHVPEVLAGYRIDSTTSLARSPSRTAIDRHRGLIDEMDRAVAEGRCERSIRDRQCAIHLFHLVGASAPGAAAAFLLRRPALWTARHWGWVLLEALGLRRRILAARRARAGG